jgi:WD40 repeat protein
MDDTPLAPTPPPNQADIGSLSGDISDSDVRITTGDVTQVQTTTYIAQQTVYTTPPTAPASPAPEPGEPPFKGLQYFDEADAPIFFGREALTSQLIDRLRLPSPGGAAPPGEGLGVRFLAVVGASGSGKSSLARAGLVPAIRHGALPGSERWPVHVITPTAHPLEALAASLTRDSESVTAAATLIDDLARDARSLHLAARRVLSRVGGERLLLAVDQFEELFTACKDEAERRAFIDNLLHAAAPETAGPTIVVITLRADFYAHCAPYDGLRMALKQSQEFIGAMNADELRRAIEEPAHQGGWEFEPGLVELLLHDVAGAPGALPLLSHALLETWRRRAGRTLTLAGYQDAGSVQGAIAKTADRVYGALAPEQQTIVRGIFLRLTELGEGTQDTRRRAALAELAPREHDRAAVEAMLKLLADARLVTTAQDTAEVAHEALIREWGTLRAWLDEDREGLRVHRHLTEAAQGWARLGRDTGELYRGARLAQAREWAAGHDGVLNAMEREFLDASVGAQERAAREREEQREREVEAARRLAEVEAERAQEAEARASEQKRAADEQRRVVIELRQRRTVAVIAAVVAVGLALFAVWAASNADQARQMAAGQAATAQAASTAAVTLRDAAAEQARQSRLVGPLAAEALYQASSQMDLAMLLGMESQLRANTSVTNGILLDLLKDTRRQATLHNAQAVGIIYSPDGKTLAAGTWSGTIILWDAATRQPIGAPLTGHTKSVISVAFSPDGKTLASGSSGSCGEPSYKCTQGEIILWDVATRQPISAPLTGHTGGVNSVVFSPDGKTFASGSGDKTIILWDVAMRQPIGAPLTGHTDWVSSVAFSPDGKTLASGSQDHTIILWDVATHTATAALLTGHTGSVNSVAFSPDGKILASGSCRTSDASNSCTQGEIILWDVATRQPIGTPLTGHTDWASSVAFSPDGKFLASGGGDNTIILWDVAMRQPIGAPLTGHTDWVSSVAFSPDGKTIASGSWDYTIILWDVTPRTAIATPLTGHTDSVNSVAFSPDGKILASGSGDNTIILWDVATRQPIGTPLTGHTDWVSSVAFSPDGKFLASGGGKNTIILWDVATRQPIGAPLTGHTDWVSSVAFSPDSKILASGSGDNTIILWDVATRQPIGAPLTGHTDWVSSVAFSPDGKFLASGGGDNTIILWDVATHQPIGAPLTGHMWMGTVMPFSPDSMTLALGSDDDTVILWDVATHQPIGAPFIGHTGPVSNVTFSPDGKTLASVNDGNTIILWDVAMRTALSTPLIGHANSVNSMVFSPDGRSLASGGRDHTVVLWDVDPASWRTRACEIAGRNLTRTEWTQYLFGEPYRATCPQWPLEPEPTPAATATP